MHIMGTWCSGITSASHAEGSGFKSQWVHSYGHCCGGVGTRQSLLVVSLLGTAMCVKDFAPTALASYLCVSSCGPQHTNHLVAVPMHSRAHGVVVSHPLRMRKALGSNPSVSICHAWCASTALAFLQQLLLQEPFLQGFSVLPHPWPRLLFSSWGRGAMH